MRSLRFATDAIIIEAINSESIDVDDLTHKETWRRICQARGRMFNRVDPEAWQSLCATRGYHLYRDNSRGF